MYNILVCLIIHPSIYLSIYSAIVSVLTCLFFPVEVSGAGVRVCCLYSPEILFPALMLHRELEAVMMLRKSEIKMTSTARCQLSVQAFLF